MLIANGSTSERLLWIKKNYKVEDLTSYPDVNARNLLIHTWLFEGKNWNFFNWMGC